MTTAATLAADTLVVVEDATFCTFVLGWLFILHVYNYNSFIHKVRTLMILLSRWHVLQTLSRIVH